MKICLINPEIHRASFNIRLCSLNFRFLWLSIISSYYCYSQSQFQELQFEHFSVDQGMPTVVNYILQDKIGYLWFATSNGLYKYDGYNFVSFKHDIDNSTSLIDNNLSTIYEDKTGTIWVGSYFGLEKFDRNTETFKHFKPNPLITGKDASNRVNAICEDDNEIMWIGTGEGLFKFNKSTKKFIRLLHDSTDSGSVNDNFISTIKRDKEGSIWIATLTGLDRLDNKTGNFIHCWTDIGNRNQNWQKISKYWNQTLLIDNSGIIWLGTNGGLIEYNPGTNIFFNHSFDPPNLQNRITSICHDSQLDILWITSWDGLFTFDKKLKKFTPLNAAGNCVLSERSGTVWIGTNYDIQKINLKTQPFKKYLINEMTCAVVNGNDKTIWIYTFSGWKKFDVKSEKIIPYSFGKDELMYVYPTGDLSLLTEQGGFYIRDSLGRIRFSLKPALKAFNYSLSWGWKTKRGFWVGTHNGGLYLFDPDSKKASEIRNLKLDINYIYEDSFGSIWVSTYMGKVFCYVPEKDSLIEFASEMKNPSSITGRVINQIYEDKSGELWFATNTGLNKFERLKNDFVHFTEKEGLPSNNVRGILEDNFGYLWLNTTKGISKFDLVHKIIKNYDITHGLELPADAYYGFGCKTNNGEMFFPSAKGLNRFHPDSVKDNLFIPPVVITSFRKFDIPCKFSNEIHLPYDENFISFEFAALSYISPEKNQYAYKLEGLDNDWVYSGTRRYASYTNLAPGEYKFRVKGSNNDGLWNEAGTSISIFISPPWWKTNWAYIFYSILILSIIYFTWKMQVKRIKINHEYEMSKFEAKKLHEVDEMKSKFFANISHEFRTPLTLILGPVKQIIERTNEEKTRDDLKVVHKSANKLLELVNQLLDISKLESGNMKLQVTPQNIIPLLKAFVMSFTSYAERKRINLKFNSVEEELIVYIDKDKFEKIITNILSNAFKFTPEGGKIEVTIKSIFSSFPPLVKPAWPIDRGELKRGFAEISIRDTGIGIPEEKIPKIFDRFYQVDGSRTREQEGTGIGLSLTKELVELHKGKIEVESEEGKGTTFKISIPLDKEHLKPEEIRHDDNEKEFEKEDWKIDIGFEEFSNRNEIDKIDIGHQEIFELPLLLIVEDNSEVRNYIKNNLYQDYQVLEAVDGEEGWNKSVDKIPDLIVSDVMMPKMDGFELCEKLKSDERTSHIPVILLTAKAESSDKIEGFEIGADDYIMKPFEPNELRARIKNLIDQRKRIQEHIRKRGIIELEQPGITSIDKKFLMKAFDIINQNMADTSFGLESFAELLSISRSVLHRKISSLTGESPGELIRRIRLKRAAQLIENNFGNMSEISLEVGFSNPSQFARSFHKQFGVSPSVYQQKFKD